MVEEQQTVENEEVEETASKKTSEVHGPKPAVEKEDHEESNEEEREGSSEDDPSVEDSDSSEESKEDEEDEPPELSLGEKLKEAEDQYTKQKDQYLRLNAEFENYKRRMTKETADRFKYYYMSLVKELLPALDSLEKAIEHAQKENTSAEALLEGIEMVYKLNQEALEKFSISKIEAVGEVFDPTIHQAVGTVESDEVPEDHVVDQFQVGYMLHDRVIRPAMVRVSKKN